MSFVERPYRILHALVGAVIARQREFRRARRGRHHARAHGLAQLEGREANAAPRTQHQQRLAGSQLRTVLECML